MKSVKVKVNVKVGSRCRGYMQRAGGEQMQEARAEDMRGGRCRGYVRGACVGAEATCRLRGHISMITYP